MIIKYNNNKSATNYKPVEKMNCRCADMSFANGSLNGNFQKNDLDSRQQLAVVWYNSQQASNFLGLSIQSLMNLVSAGKIPHYKFGRRNRYKLSELNNLLEENKKGPFYDRNST